MDGLKGFADIAKHLLYETFGLLIPGGVLAFGAAWVLGPKNWSAWLAFISDHPLLTLVAAYLLGYPLQSLSRPIITIAEWVLVSPTRLLGLIGRTVLSQPYQTKVLTAVQALEDALLRRHRHDHARGDGGETGVRLDDLVREHWQQRLSLPPDKVLSRQQAIDLAFSGVLPERDRLDRFRAAASLARGVAAALTLLATAVAIQFVSATPFVSPTWHHVGMVVLYILVLYGLLERADMYDWLWRSVVPAQFLCSATAGPTKALPPGGAPLSDTEAS
jgi:hypothetical protein